MWGSGWLAHLGDTLALGHGFVDFGGSALVLWLPGMMALGILLLQPREPVSEPPPPPAYFPLLANLGALFVGIGWTGWALSTPFHTSGATWYWGRAAVNMLLGMAGATVTSQLYAWLVTGKLETLLAARGLAAGWGAALAAAPFLPPWAALAGGLLTGLIFPFLLYLVEAVLRLRDAAATVALGLVGGVWGLLGVGLFADGRSGQGWNGVAGVEGVSGLLFGGGTSQLVAQLIGIVALGAWGLLWGVILGAIANPRFLRRGVAAVKSVVTSGADSAEHEAVTDVVVTKDEGELEDTRTIQDEEAPPVVDEVDASAGDDVPVSEMEGW